MTRLLDRMSQRFAGRGLEPSGAAVLTTSYGAAGNEPIQPQFMAATQRAYTGNAVVFGAILARLSLFSEAEFKFRRLTDKKLFGTNEPDGLRILEYPWPNGTTGELLARMIQDNDLAGNAYVWNAGDQLVRLRPDWVTIISELVEAPMGGQYRKVLGYWYQPSPTEMRRPPPMLLPVEDVAHWSPNPDPYADFRGMSWLTPVIREVTADNAMTSYKIKYLENAASPNLLIKYSQKLAPDTLSSLRERVHARYGGVDNAFKTLVLDEGADATVIGNTFEQMNFSTVQAAGENRIVIASGVPGIVIGSKEGLMAATYSNYEQAMRRFSDVTMRPLWRSVCACLAKLVAVPAGSRLWFDTSDIAALRQGEKERAETMQILATAAKELSLAGYGKDSIVAALAASDLNQLTATELVPRQLIVDPTTAGGEPGIPSFDAAGSPLPAAAAGAPALNGAKPAPPAVPAVNGARP